ncbi:hypothetical protein D3C87_603820 [compost metagenome]
MVLGWDIEWSGAADQRSALPPSLDESTTPSTIHHPPSPIPLTTRRPEGQPPCGPQSTTNHSPAINHPPPLTHQPPPNSKPTPPTAPGSCRCPPNAPAHCRGLVRVGWRDRWAPWMAPTSLQGGIHGVSRQPTRADPTRGTAAPQLQLQLQLQLRLRLKLTLQLTQKSRAPAHIPPTLTPSTGTSLPHTAAQPPSPRPRNASADSRPTRAPPASPAKYRSRSPAPATPTRPPSHSDR